MNNQKPKLQLSIVAVLPACIHLGVCLAIWLNHADDRVWQKMFFVDFPFTVIEVGLMFKGVDPLISIGIGGTLWWYVLTLAIRSLFRAYKKYQA